MRWDGAVERIKRDVTVDTWHVLSQNWCQDEAFRIESDFNSISIILRRKPQILP